MDGWEDAKAAVIRERQALVRLAAGRAWSSVWCRHVLFPRQLPAGGVGRGVRGRGLPPRPSCPSLMTTLVPRSAVAGDARNDFDVEPGATGPTHFLSPGPPTAGVAQASGSTASRVPDPRLLPATIDLAALENGAVVNRCSNLF